jgi:hypothetical protein
VVDATKGQPPAGAAEAGAQDMDLDSLLAQFEVEPPEQEVAAPKLSPDDVRSAVQYAKSEQERRAKEGTDKAISEAVKTVKEELGDLPVHLSDRAARGLLEAYAAENPKFTQAFMHRQKNPEAWNKALRAVGKEFRSDFAPVDRNATDDREAITSAVRAASTPAQRSADQPNWHQMSDAEFNRRKREMGM